MNRKQEISSNSLTEFVEPKEEKSSPELTLRKGKKEDEDEDEEEEEEWLSSGDVLCGSRHVVEQRHWSSLRGRNILAIWSFNSGISQEKKRL